MKKTLLSIITVTMLASCFGGNGKESENAEEQGKDTIEAKDETQQQAEAEPVKKEVPTDLQAWELQGKVKKCEWKKRYVTTTYSFDEKGFITKASGVSWKSKKRDDKGRLVKATGGEYDTEFTEEWKFDECRMTEYRFGDAFTTSKYTYKYNDEGLVESYKVSGTTMEDYDCPEIPLNETVTYTYEKDDIDAQGNWTKRKGKSSDGSTWTETRKITYNE